MYRRNCFPLALLVFGVVVLFLCLTAGTVCAAEPSRVETGRLTDVIQAQTDPSLYTYLQSAIDNSLLPGYQVAGKTIFTYYLRYDFSATDKSLKACVERSKNLQAPHFIILEDTRYFVLKHVCDGEVAYVYEEQSEWDFLCKMLMETDAVTELCGAKRTITGVMCFQSYNDGYVIYFETTDGIFIRHYGCRYESSGSQEGTYIAKDYNLDDFIDYTNRFTAWNKTGDHCSVCASFSGYMSEGAPDPAPVKPDSAGVSPVVWIAISIGGVVFIGGTATGVLLYYRKRMVSL